MPQIIKFTKQAATGEALHLTLGVFPVPMPTDFTEKFIPTPTRFGFFEISPRIQLISGSFNSRDWMHNLKFITAKLALNSAEFSPKVQYK